MKNYNRLKNTLKVDDVNGLVYDLIQVNGDKQEFAVLPHCLNAYLKITGLDNAISMDLTWVSKNFGTFCNDYLIPSNVTFNQTTYSPFDYQQELANLIDTSRIIGVFKSRQLGLSETLCAYIIWRMLGAGNGSGGKGFKAIVYSQTQYDAKKLGDRITVMLSGILDRIPPWRLNNRDYRALSGGWGEVEFLPVTGGRGIPAVDLIVVDEADWIEEISETLKAAKPTLSASKGTLVQVTTPNGAAGETYKLLEKIIPDIKKEITELPDTAKKWKTFKKNIEGESMAGMLIHWQAHPYYDQAWCEKTKNALAYTDEEWNQEYELSIENSIQLYFSLKNIADCRRYIAVSKNTNNVRFASLDTGGKRDNVALCIVEYNEEENIFELIGEYYEKNQSTLDQDISIVAMCEKYRIDKLVVEVNHNVTQAENLRQALLGIEVIEHFTTAARKNTALNNLRKLLYNKRFFLEPGSFLDIELPTIQKKRIGAKFTVEARAGYNDDMTMAVANCIYHMLDYTKMNILLTEVTEDNIQKELFI